MSSLKQNLFAILENVRGSGAFVVQGTIPCPYLGLHIEGYGEIGLPIHPDQAQKVIESAATLAPYGKGSQTLTDTAVRNTFEVDASKLRFEEKALEDFLTTITEKVKEGLGFKNKNVEARLYKLLIYKPGGFFLTHQDSEKEPGMFGSLVVSLPSAHKGGSLQVRFEGVEETIDFSKLKGNETGFAAFFADCEHEIKTVTEGYRVCLVFNLIQTDSAKSITSPKYDTQTEQLTTLLKTHLSEFDENPRAILLGHQYTPNNFNANALKGNDGAVFETLFNAAAEAGYYASLGLVTYHLTGEPAYDYYSSKRGRRSYYDEYDEYDVDENASMEEVHDSELGIENWGIGAAPGLGYLSLEESNILANFDLDGTQDPIKKDFEGYMGNYGPTLEYWYHYGAVVLWPKSLHTDMLATRSPHVQLEWLEYYVNKWDEKDQDYPTLAKNVFEKGLADVVFSENSGVYSLDAVVNYMYRSGEAGLSLAAILFLNNNFQFIDASSWSKLIELYGIKPFQEVLISAGESGKQPQLENLLQTLIFLAKNKKTAEIQTFIHQQTNTLPDYLKRLVETKEEKPNWGHFQKQKSKISRILLQQTLALHDLMECDDNHAQAMATVLTSKMNREFVHNILATVLTESPNTDLTLYKLLKTSALDFLKQKTETKPQPPTDWSRQIPEASGYYQEEWSILRPFMENPNQKYLDYTQNADLRKKMESAITSANLDLNRQTVKIGRPYTLRLIKNQATYERNLKTWQKDMKLLNKLETA